MAILVIAELDGQLKADTAKVVHAAQAIGGDVHLLVAGHQVADAAQAGAALAGVTQVLVADDARFEHGLAENLADLIVSLGRDYSHILAAASAQGKDALPRAAALLDVSMLSDVVAVESADTFIRPIYAGNAMATVQSLDAIKVMTIRTAAFDAVGEQAAAPVVAASGGADTGLTQFVGLERIESERPELGAARVVVSGGRGVGSGENFALIEALADTLGGAVGASRAAVDAGFVPNDYQVGQTGKIVAPELYVAVGISGAIQHLAGMKDSKVIVAINKDPEAPIFQVADYGLEADLFEVLPQLTAQLA
ncbi:Electron transfer flavoprotein alpha subunit [Ferrimonas balearica DSM 9799]|uniref:Electron transfer flavoprotein subunit alpha n=1 Tax=Ferrimonas balearica (strain DSM 9799 / CCM 4581 / KCTC 23876 / PAT) TaxID=550540 RepID=E1SU43_FERBD|nr:FAD-binding protein [Ferrimonas balearica]ADN75190.1 Electron transfer flavoprotein alpha subunit [Ferrimonas balearica DSM 9799]MBW3138086.1 FAD-binding protein [Ferrimonas balearica]MBW3164347.1 FAD-binding protein [Ferrimonas balearica]MBY5978853.1 FAD-binding protein [Ferrimonas balearica]